MYMYKCSSLCEPWARDPTEETLDRRTRSTNGKGELVFCSVTDLRRATVTGITFVPERHHTTFLQRNGHAGNVIHTSSVISI